MKTPISPNATHVFVITHLGADGLHHLSASANQSRYHHATRKEANTYLNAMLKNNSKETLVSIHGAQAWGTYRVEKVECYPGGDAKKTIFEP